MLTSESLVSQVDPWWGIKQSFILKLFWWSQQDTQIPPLNWGCQDFNLEPSLGVFCLTPALLSRFRSAHLVLPFQVHSPYLPINVLHLYVISHLFLFIVTFFLCLCPGRLVLVAAFQPFTCDWILCFGSNPSPDPDPQPVHFGLSLPLWLDLWFWLFMLQHWPWFSAELSKINRGDRGEAYRQPQDGWTFAHWSILWTVETLTAEK